MPIINECLRTRSEVTQLKVLDNDLVAYATALNGIKLFSATECESKLNFADKNLNSLVSSITFSKNAKYLAFSAASNIYIVHLPNHKLIKTIKATEDIELLAFDPSSTYIIAGTKNGRVLQYKYNHSSLISRLHSFKLNQKTTLSAFSFYAADVACGTSNGEICILNIYSRAHKINIINSNSQITALFYYNEDLIISGNTNGEVYFNSILSDAIKKKIDSPFTIIKQILPMSNPNFILVCGDTNSVCIINIKTFKVQHTKYVEFEEDIVQIDTYNNDMLFAALKNNTIVHVELPSASRLKSHIIHNSLDLAYKLIQTDATLRDSQEYLELEKKYQVILEKATQALMNQNKKLAIEIIDVFKDINEKKEEINALFKAFENYPRFQTLYREKKYALAYAMSNKFPPLQKTYPFTLMERDWKECFKNAQRHIIQGNIDNAKALLQEYMTVQQKRAVIDMMLTKNDKFIEFVKAVENKNYQKISELSKQNDIFTQIPTYKNLENETEQKLNDIKVQICMGDIQTAKDILSSIEHTPQNIKKISILQQKLLTMQKLKSAYARGDFKTCYETIDANRTLIFSELGLKLEEEWSLLMAKCEEAALKGDIKELKNLLGDLLLLETRREKIGDLLRVSFHTKIKILLAKQSYKQAENIIYSYIDIFGLDTEISVLMQLFEQTSKHSLALTYNQNKRPPRDNWIHSLTITD